MYTEGVLLYVRLQQGAEDWRIELIITGDNSVKSTFLKHSFKDSGRDIPPTYAFIIPQSDGCLATKHSEAQNTPILPRATQARL